jgi:hypothetical protein
VILIPGTRNSGLPGRSLVMNSAAPNRMAAARFSASPAANPCFLANTFADFPSASLNGSQADASEKWAL